jgi:hypothetical protein
MTDAKVVVMMTQLGVGVDGDDAMFGMYLGWY